MLTGARIPMSTPIRTTTTIRTPMTTAATSTPAPLAPDARTPSAQLAKQLQELGENTAYEQIMLAVSDFEKGNLRLSTVLTSMNG